MTIAFDLIESALLEDQNHALTAMKKQGHKLEERLLAALKIVYNTESSPSDLFHAHILITTALITETWEGFVVADLANLLSAQWLKKNKIPSDVENTYAYSTANRKSL